MTKEAALQSFFGRFGRAYPAADVPHDAELPYLSYTNSVGAWGDLHSLTVDLWDYGSSNTEINAKAQELSEALGLGGVLLSCDGGAIWLKRGAPWCQTLRQEGDDGVKRRRINITAEYLSAD